VATGEPVIHDDDALAGSQLVPHVAAELYAMTATWAVDEDVLDTILPNKMPHSQLSAAWEDFPVEPKLSARQNWETELSDDVFYQLAAVKAPFRIESDSDESELSDDDATDGRFGNVRSNESSQGDEPQPVIHGFPDLCAFGDNDFELSFA
jgi:hypothetical protein